MITVLGVVVCDDGGYRHYLAITADPGASESAERGRGRLAMPPVLNCGNPPL